MTSSHGSDESTLQRAHLLYVRGEKQQARELLETFLLSDPQNRDAIHLRDEIEMEMVEDVIEEEQRTGMIEEPLGSGQILGRVFTGIVFVVVSVLIAVPIVVMGIEKGFSTEILVSFGKGASKGRYPVHFLLVFPTFLLIGGVCILFTTIQHARAQSD